MTTSLQSFNGKVKLQMQHLQISDVSLNKAKDVVRASTQAKCHNALGVSRNKYCQLDRPRHNIYRIVSYSKSRNHESTIIYMYKCFSEYLRDILGEMFAKNPLLVVSKTNGGNAHISFQDIIKIGNYVDLSRHMVDVVFRSIENKRSTVRLLDDIIDKTGISLPSVLKNYALSYLELRHLFIHNSGLIDDLYASKYGVLNGLNPGDRIPTTYATSDDVICCITALCEKIDECLVNCKAV